MNERAFDFVPLNRRDAKPRKRGLTEIRGPYYTPMGRRYLSDVLETMGHWIDGLKYAGGSFVLMPRERVRELNALAHAHDVKVSTGGFVEHLLTLKNAGLIDRYLAECKELGFDVVELSAGFLTMADDDLLRLVEKVQRAGLVPKPEVGIQLGAGGATSAERLERAGTRDVSRPIRTARRCLEAGAPIIMIESEGITESVTEWRTDVVMRIANELGLERVMFEAAEPAVFQWYVQTFGPHVNLFVDHSQIVQLEALRSGTWGTHDLFGRVVTFQGE